MKPIAGSLLILAACSLYAVVPASAQPVAAQTAAAMEAPSPERLDLARKFISVSLPADDTIENIRAGFLGSASADLMEVEDKAEREAATAKMDAVFTRFEPKLRELLPQFLEANAQAYAQEFSADELRQMLAFAESPTGRHYTAQKQMLGMSPDVVRAQYQLIHGIEPMVEELRRQACAERTAKRIAMGDKKATCPLARKSDTAAG